MQTESRVMTQRKQPALWDSHSPSGPSAYHIDSNTASGSVLWVRILILTTFAPSQCIMNIGRRFPKRPALWRTRHMLKKVGSAPDLWLNKFIRYIFQWFWKYKVSIQQQWYLCCYNRRPEYVIILVSAGFTWCHQCSCINYSFLSWMSRELRVDWWYWIRGFVDRHVCSRFF